MSRQFGLRERKKLATRSALSRAARRLAVERGLDRLTPEAIAEAAQVSPRTFRNYFSSKEEAVAGTLLDQVHGIADELRGRPADEPILQSLRQVVPVVAGRALDDPGQTVELLRLIKNSPALLAQYLTVFEAVHRELVDVIAERTGTDAGRDAYPRLLAATASMSIKIALDLWGEGRVEAGLPELIEDALTRLSGGLPTPVAERARPGPHRPEVL